MDEHQCAHCGHITTGFEQQEFDVRAAEITALRSRCEGLERAMKYVVQECETSIKQIYPAQYYLANIEAAALTALRASTSEDL